MPLQFPAGVTRKSLQLTGTERISLRGLTTIGPGSSVLMEITGNDGSQQSCELICRLDTALEVAYFTSSGIMPYVVNKLIAS